MQRSRSVVVTALLATLLLSGCTPEPESEPLFSSDAEALAAAVEVYEEYLAVSNAVAKSRGSGTDALYAVAQDDALELALESARSFEELAGTVTGDMRLRDSKLVDFNPATATVEFLVCLDISQVQVFDSAGNSLVAETRPDLQGFSAVVIWSETNQGKLSSRTPVSYEEVCE